MPQYNAIECTTVWSNTKLETTQIARIDPKNDGTCKTSKQWPTGQSNIIWRGGGGGFGFGGSLRQIKQKQQGAELWTVSYHLCEKMGN